MPIKSAEWWPSYFDSAVSARVRAAVHARTRPSRSRAHHGHARPAVRRPNPRRAMRSGTARASARGSGLRRGRLRLLARSAGEGAQARGTGASLRYTRGDMRRCPARWTGRFDAVLNLFTSFGFFAEPADDRHVVEEFARMLTPGGVLIWYGGSRDGVMARFLERDWWQTDDGTLIAQERSFDLTLGRAERPYGVVGNERAAVPRAPHSALHADAPRRAVRRRGTHRRGGVRRLRRAR